MQRIIFVTLLLLLHISLKSRDLTYLGALYKPQRRGAAGRAISSIGSYVAPGIPLPKRAQVPLDIVVEWGDGQEGILRRRFAKITCAMQHVRFTLMTPKHWDGNGSD